MPYFFECPDCGAKLPAHDGEDVSRKCISCGVTGCKWCLGGGYPEYFICDKCVDKEVPSA